MLALDPLILTFKLQGIELEYQEWVFLFWPCLLMQFIMLTGVLPAVR